MLEGSGVLDMVAAGTVKAAHVHARERRDCSAALVSTNSIVQGEQVGVLWGWLLAQFGVEHPLCAPHVSLEQRSQAASPRCIA